MSCTKLIANMSKGAVSCTLRSLDNPTKCIILPNNKTIYLGRSQVTGISDPDLSRKQLSATADYKNYTVLIKTTGRNYSGCNGYALMKDSIYHLHHKDYLELLISLHKFEVVFDPPPEENEIRVDEPSFKKKKENCETSVAANSLDNHDQKSGCWETIDNGELLIYTFGALKPQTKIASFDLDGTLIKTKSGARFPKDSEDWVLNLGDVTHRLKDLFNDNFKIVIFSNQAGLGLDKAKIKQFKTKILNVCSYINVPIQIFVATTKGIYRKPAPGMWHTLCKEKNDGVEIDVADSFYVGDAAGRPKNWALKKNKDHSISDRLFAINLNLRFYTPEEYFLKSNSSTVPFVMPKFDPRNVVVGQVPTCDSRDREVVIMVGCPASGKSYYCTKYFSKFRYVYVNRDSLGSWQNCVKLVEKSFKNKQNVIVDNTNPDKATRKKYIDLAKENNFSVRCFLMTTSLEHCKHNNKFRSLTDKKHVLVGDAVLNMYHKQFQEPTLDEGFTDIVKIDFIPNFDNPEDEKLYKMFLLES